ncbi:MAG: carboxylesterase/lipase family protein [Pseudomonadales bacterium]
MTGSVQVSTSKGRLDGRLEEGLAVFRGIPFAAPPVGDLRWRPPEPVEPWGGVRDATRFGPAELQDPGPLGALLGITVNETSEDCLYLNVWSPDVQGKRPVMVWIHGGAFIVGAGSQDLYDGRRLAGRGDVVVVTLNYRLGVFGFLQAPLLGATGNEGLLDQIAALEWVRSEIAAFGGDPDNVTIFGESAGAISIGHLLGMPAADGLYHRAILQSGGPALATTPGIRSGVESELLAGLGLTAESAATAWSASAEEVYRAGQRVIAARAAGGVQALPFSPVVGTPDLPEPPLARVRAGVHRHVSVMTGTCRDEMALFLVADPSLDELDDAGLAARVAVSFPGDAAAAVAAYRAARSERGEGTSPRQLAVAMLSDAVFRIPDIRLAESQSAHQEDVYMYLVDWPSPAMGGVLGACHAVDLGFTFGTHASGEHAGFYGTGAAADRLSDTFIAAWSAFARTGNPNAEGLPAWPRYEPGSRRTLRLGETVDVQSAPMDPERAAWGPG